MTHEPSSPRQPPPSIPSDECLPREATLLMVLAKLSMAYPRTEITEGTLMVYVESLIDLNPDYVIRAAKRIPRESKWFPSISEIRDAVRAEYFADRLDAPLALPEPTGKDDRRTVAARSILRDLSAKLKMDKGKPLPVAVPTDPRLRSRPKDDYRERTLAAEGKRRAEYIPQPYREPYGDYGDGPTPMDPEYDWGQFEGQRDA